MDDYESMVARSLTQRDAERIANALKKLNASLGVEFDGVLKQYDEHGEFVGLFWMDTESEEWLYDPKGEENG